MCKNNFLRTACLTALLGLLVCNVSAQLVLRATDQICWNDSCSTWQDKVPADPTNCIGGGYWNRTYNGSAKPLLIGENFLVSHDAGFDEYSYWSGATTGSNGDTLCYSSYCPRPASCVKPGSEDWVHNQWGVMAGGGLDGSNNTVQGLPYFISYWDYFSDGIDLDAQSVKVQLADSALFEPQEVWICNHPWPYYGNQYGDGFARPLNQPGDYFILKINGLDASGGHLGTVVDTLAVYDPLSPFGVRQNTKWHMVDLTDQFKDDLSALYFTMFSTDSVSGGYGLNTAVYFCMDKLTVTPTGNASTNAVVQQAKAPSAPKYMEVTDYFPIASYTGGEVVVLDTKGKEVLKTIVNAGEKVNLSELPAGEYRLRHGHRYIPIRKGTAK